MSTASSNKVLVLFGPTASGKTELLERLFLEVHRGLPKAEVVSADSMQVYRGMDLGTAKPDSVLRAALPHHLLDIRDPNEQYTAGDFVREADLACAEIRSRGRLPVVSGGTAFYIRNFVCGLPGSPAADPAVRAAVARDLAELGFAALRAELEAGDPVSAARIHPRDTYRLSRALEVMRRTGRPLSEHQVPDRPRPGLDPLFLALDRPRDELYSRIDARVKAMFSAGLAAEVSRLLARGYGEGDPGMQAIGYREFLEARRAGCSRMLD
ncbi:MAG TPA: tRNA (adenosine(37)-N6)-dimethylallyltransferase MiaA, partial [Magnetospirillaceae bacterium]|nr:tRNA (adenosine(37)-N6)-dimethylallyltransferase MiaA [Magnetospirillaceae bacterium]